MTTLPYSLQLSLKACRTLPSMPAVALQVLELCQDDEVSIGKVAKVLVRDPALASKVLRVANSPYYGVRSQVTTVERAITILGINATLSLALSFSLVKGLRASGTSGFDYRIYWQNSAIAATAARVIGAWGYYASRDELFLAGLLQNIGMLVLSEAMPKSYGKLIRSANGDHALLVELERKKLGADHAETGAWLLERWNLPVNLQLATASSHGAKGEGEELPIFSRCVAVAGFIASIWSSADAGKATSAAYQQAELLLGMSYTQFDKMLGEIALELPEATMNLDINIGEGDFIDRILDQARGALIELNLQANRETRKMQLLAQRDELTKLANRTYLNDVLPHQFESSRQLQQPLSILFIDVDNFKKINDTYGHQGGDRVLESVARALKLCTRDSDIVVRYGGDEFVIVLQNTDEAVLSDLANRIQKAASLACRTMDNGEEIPVTISIGCATMSRARPYASVSDLIEAADQCLYAAKTGGRNRVVVDSNFNQSRYPEGLLQNGTVN